MCIWSVGLTRVINHVGDAKRSNAKKLPSGSVRSGGVVVNLRSDTLGLFPSYEDVVVTCHTASL